MALASMHIYSNDPEKVLTKNISYCHPYCIHSAKWAYLSSVGNKLLAFAPKYYACAAVAYERAVFQQHSQNGNYWPSNFTVAVSEIKIISLNFFKPIVKTAGNPLNY
jgi:hypothetical protein